MSEAAVHVKIEERHGGRASPVVTVDNAAPAQLPVDAADRAR